MAAKLLGMLAETSVHAGAGQSTGFVDLPVAREAATDYPVLVGSSLKGALRQSARQHELPDIDRVFGEQECAGEVLVSDARLLLLPIRSLQGQFKWVTCPYVIERLVRDSKRSGQSAEYAVTSVSKGGALATGEGNVFLEERQFEVNGGLPDGLIDLITPLIAHEPTRARLTEQVVVLHNDDFAWFARFGLAVNARNVLDPDCKTSKNLWYEETLPPDTLLYAVLADRRDGASLTTLSEHLSTTGYLQAGGNETVGQGWFALQLVGGA